MSSTMPMASWTAGPPAAADDAGVADRLPVAPDEGLRDETSSEQDERKERAARIGKQRRDGKDTRPRGHDHRGPRVSPRAERTLGVRLAAPQYDEREAADEIIQREQ